MDSIITSRSRTIDRARRRRRFLAAVGATATIIALAGVGGDNASARAPYAAQADDPTGLGAALAVTYAVLPPGIDNASQLGYPEAACATDLRTWILGT